ASRGIRAGRAGADGLPRDRRGGWASGVCGGAWFPEQPAARSLTPDRLPGMSTRCLRTASLVHLRALLALEAQFPGDRLSARGFRHHLGNPRADLRLILADGYIAGYHLVLDRRLSRWSRLYSIAVGWSVRGAGLGRQLLADAESRARARGRRGLRLEVRVDNEAAIRLYESAGYARGRRIRRYYDDGKDAWRYGKCF